MNNPTIFNQLINRYNKIAYTHEYIFGFEYRGNIYFAFAKSDLMPFVCTLDRDSRGGGISLRFVPNKAQKLLLMTSAELLCSAKLFNDLKAESKYNKGEIFEKLITERDGQEWTKDNVPFTESGDVVISGIHYQIKFYGATFCNEKSIANLEKRVA